MEYKMDLEALKQADVARLLGKNERTIQRWHDQGLPRRGSGRGAIYVWTEVLAWYVAFMSCSAGGADGAEGGGGLSYKDRIDKAKAEDSELDLEAKRGTLLSAADVRETWSAECAAMRARLLSIPATAALKIDPSHSQSQREEILRREVHEALESLSGEQG